MYNTSRFDNRNSSKPFARQDRRPFARTDQRNFDNQSERATPVQIFTFRERTVKTHSVRQAYEQAAMAFRALSGEDKQRQIFPQDQWTKADEEITLTLQAFSEKVDSILFNLKCKY